VTLGAQSSESNARAVLSHVDELDVDAVGLKEGPETIEDRFNACAFDHRAFAFLSVLCEHASAPTASVGEFTFRSCRPVDPRKVATRVNPFGRSAAHTFTPACSA
jgi:hypothetical protein